MACAPPGESRGAEAQERDATSPFERGLPLMRNMLAAMR